MLVASAAVVPAVTAELVVQPLAVQLVAVREYAVALTLVGRPVMAMLCAVTPQPAPTPNGWTTGVLYGPPVPVAVICESAAVPVVHEHRTEFGPLALHANALMVGPCADSGIEIVRSDNTLLTYNAEP